MSILDDVCATMHAVTEGADDKLLGVTITNHTLLIRLYWIYFL